MSDFGKTPSIAGLRVRITLAALGLAGIVGYLVLALTDMKMIGFWGASFGAFVVFALVLGKVLGPERLISVALLSFVLLGFTLVGDSAVKTRQVALTVASQPDLRTTAKMKMRDILPPTYRARPDLALYRPNFSARALVSGAGYDEAGPDILGSEKFEANIIEEQVVEYTIDEHGWRNDLPWDQTQVIATGDSFTFGISTPLEQTWPKRIEALTGKRVYNMGFNGASPLLELDQLEHMLEKNGKPEGLETIVWMLYEGNDLEESSPLPPLGVDKPMRVGWQETPIFAALFLVPGRVRSSSQLRGWMQASQAPPPSGVPLFSEYDGVRIDGQVFDAPGIGAKWFYYSNYILRARMTRDEVRNHPHLPAVSQAMERMRDRTLALGARPLWVIATSAPRLYAEHYDGFPEISKQPHFIEWLLERSEELGVEVVDLNQAMRPHAAKEMLYLRDDTHWNARGNQLAAEAIAKVMTSTPAAAP